MRASRTLSLRLALDLDLAAEGLDDALAVVDGLQAVDGAQQGRLA
jgi:hypothetical protein